MRLGSCGLNGRGQLGQGHCDDVDEVRGVLREVVAGVLEEWGSIDAVVGGGNHTLVLAAGEVYGAGDNLGFQLGAGAGGSVFRHMPHPHGKRWKGVAAGWEFSVLVDEDGAVYTAGTGHRGELGLGEGVTTARVLTRVPGLAPVLLVVLAMLHTLAVSDGTVYGWGNGRRGQLGEKRVAWVPVVVHVAAAPVEVNAGREFSLVGTADGHVFYGHDRFGMAAAERWTGRTFVMWSLVHRVAAEIESLGNDSHLQCRAPRGPVLRVATGSEHGLCVLELDPCTVVAWGWGEHGNCGKAAAGSTAAVSSAYAPTPLYTAPGPVAAVFAGCATLWVVF